MANKARKSMKRTVRGASRATERAIDEVSARAGNSLVPVEQMIERNPVGVLAAALGVGVILGMIARR
jgi:ElaB/YqjD/DUF883 family membrane-anchored ribosome-binding protein